MSRFITKKDIPFFIKPWTPDVKLAVHLDIWPQVINIHQLRCKVAQNTVRKFLPEVAKAISTVSLIKL